MRRPFLVLLTALLVCVTACGSAAADGGPSGSGTPAATPYPTLSADISPTKGHVHLYLNNQLIYMAYTLQQAITVKPGLEYTMYAEFVAQDHFPFDPRDITPTIFFTVAPG
jgi:hypothetical protein